MVYKFQDNEQEYKTPNIFYENTNVIFILKYK